MAIEIKQEDKVRLVETLQLVRGLAKGELQLTDKFYTDYLSLDEKPLAEILQDNADDLLQTIKMAKEIYE